MGAIVTGIVAAFALAVAALLLLSAIQEPAYERYATTSTRVDEPGTNLVGDAWSGNPAVRGSGS
jgi:hypothetical protein